MKTTLNDEKIKDKFSEEDTEALTTMIDNNMEWLDQTSERLKFMKLRLRNVKASANLI